MKEYNLLDSLGISKRQYKKTHVQLFMEGFRAVYTET